MADYLEANYTNYARGIEYLRKLAGQIAMRRIPPKRIEFLLLNMAGIQRGAVILGNPEIHTIHTMRVTFHRFHWQSSQLKRNPLNRFQTQCSFNVNLVIFRYYSNANSHHQNPRAIGLKLVSPPCTALHLVMQEVKQEVPSNAALKVALAPNGWVNFETGFPKWYRKQKTSLGFQGLATSFSIWRQLQPPLRKRRSTPSRQH